MILISVLLANNNKQSVDDIMYPNTILIIVNRIQLQLIITNMTLQVDPTFDTQNTLSQRFPL